jgi:hypothetical protein
MNQLSFGTTALLFALSMPFAENAQAMGDMKDMNMPVAPAAGSAAAPSAIGA